MVRTYIEVYGPDHKLVAKVLLRNATEAERRHKPHNRPDSGVFTDEVTIPIGGYIVVVNQEDPELERLASAL